MTLLRVLRQPVPPQEVAEKAQHEIRKLESLLDGRKFSLEGDRQFQETAGRIRTLFQSAKQSPLLAQARGTHPLVDSWEVFELRLQALQASWVLSSGEYRLERLEQRLSRLSVHMQNEDWEAMNTCWAALRKEDDPVFERLIEEHFQGFLGEFYSKFQALEGLEEKLGQSPCRSSALPSNMASLKEILNLCPELLTQLRLYRERLNAFKSMTREAYASQEWVEKAQVLEGLVKHFEDLQQKAVAICIKEIKSRANCRPPGRGSTEEYVKQRCKAVKCVGIIIDRGQVRFLAPPSVDPASLPLVFTRSLSIDGFNQMLPSTVERLYNLGWEELRSSGHVKN